MKNNTIIFVVALISALVATFCLGCMVARKHYEKAIKQADTVIKVDWKHDTIYEPKDSIIYKWRTAYLPVHDTTEVSDTVTVHDSVLVDVPIWEKSYASSNYHLTIRGYQPELVDIWVKQTEAIVKVPYRKPWSFTVGPQAGFGITPKGWQPYAGVGITFGYSF